MPTTTLTAKQISELCSASYQECLKETKRELRGVCLRSRGKFVYALGDDGNVHPDFECDSVIWEGTQKQLNKLLERTDITYLGIQGGLDCADSIRDFGDGNYDPLVAEWNVDIWSKGE